MLGAAKLSEVCQLSAGKITAEGFLVVTVHFSGYVLRYQVLT